MNSSLDMVNDIKSVYGFYDRKILDTLKKVPREEFIPKKLRHLAYFDNAVPIGYGQTISQPFTVAFMTYLLDLKKTDKVLEIGTGSGYQAAVLSLLAKEVYTIERIKELALNAESIFKKLKYKNIKTKIGQGEKGWKEHAPFDVILITANTPKVSQTLFKQLKEKGRLVAPIGKGISGIMTRFIKSDNKFKKQKYGKYFFVPLISS